MVTTRDFVHTLRLSGTVEAVESTTIAAPRLAGQGQGALVVVRLAPAGTHVRRGEQLVEFDRQEQLKAALDRRAELDDLEQQIRKREAEERAARARDESEIALAGSARERARLEMIKNDMLPKIQAEKNTQNLEEAEAKLAQLKASVTLKRRAAESDLRILRIRRDRAEAAMRQAESNASRMLVTSPLDGLVVIRTVWKGGTMGDIQEGEEVRGGLPVLDVVSPGRMRVRVRVNQGDIGAVRQAQPARIGLDAYPELEFDGRVEQVSPLAVASALNPKVRTFAAIVTIDGSHPNLMPDLTAWVDLEVARQPAVLVVPRDAVRSGPDGAFVRVRRGVGFEDRRVTLGPASAHEVVIAEGLEEGAEVDRHLSGRPSR